MTCTMRLVGLGLVFLVGIQQGIADTRLDTGNAPSLISNLPSGQPVGTEVIWWVQPDSGSLFQFSVAKDGGPFSVVRNFSTISYFSWVPIQEGNYEVRVEARPLPGDVRREAVTPFTVVPIASGTEAVVTGTRHPLVALYSAPPGDCDSVFVEYSRVGGEYWIRTSEEPCSDGRSVNFHVAGMLGQTTYRMRHVSVQREVETPSPVVLFTTGTPSVRIPDVVLLNPPDAETSWEEPFILFAGLDVFNPSISFPVAVDLVGRPVWYYDRDRDVPGSAYVTRPTGEGTMLLLMFCCRGADTVLLEVDLAGNTLRQTTQSAINLQLQELGIQKIRAIHHEATRFPNGQTLVLGMVEKPGDPPILGDLVIALDENFKVLWTWNAFDHLDTDRHALLGETCGSEYGPFCAASTPDAEDWLHSNSIDYSAVDGNLIVSVRNQDWIIKIDYQDGAGSGDVLWRLGREGDFSTDVEAPFPWFSHQHDAIYVGENSIAVYDNGTTRCVMVSEDCSSRGQVWEINETDITATLTLNADLGVFAPAYGSAQKLRTGNFQFGSGFIFPSLTSRATEVTPDGAINYDIETGLTEYRAIRMRSLYEP